MSERIVSRPVPTSDAEPRSVEGLRLLQLIDAVLLDAARTVSGAA